VGLSRGDYAVEGDAVRAEVAFARKELAGLVAGLDANHDGALTAAEIEAGRDSIQGAVVGRIKVMGDGAPCAGKLDRVELAEADGVVVRALYRCARRPQQAAVTLALMEDLPFGHRHLVRAFAAAGPQDLVLSQRAPSFTFAVPAAAASAPSPRDAGALGRVQRMAGAWPIPVFLLGLFARCAGGRPMLAAAGAFAAALFAGLAASVFGMFTPSPRAAAAAMAASLAYVGIDNFARDERGPWIALPFGAIHGLGCAAAFRAAEGGTLGGFALGVLGALAAVVAALVVGVTWTRERRVFRADAAIALNLGIAAAGLVGVGLALR
jgi:hypothetical protein